MSGTCWTVLSMRYVRELTVFSEAELRMLPRVGSVTIAEIRRVFEISLEAAAQGVRVARDAGSHPSGLR